MHGSVDHTAEIEEIVWILKFSRIFFDAFQIEVDRVNQWRFLTFLLRFERDSKISVVELTDDGEFEKFIKKSKNRTKDYVFKQLVADFRNEHGSFLDLPQHQKKDRALTLNSHFYAAAKSYITCFIDSMSEGAVPWDANSADQGRILGYLKTLINFQNTRYYPPWLAFIGELAELGENEELSKKNIADDLYAHAPYWCLLLTVWRKHLGDHTVSTTSSGLWRAVFDSMRGADPEEVKNCIGFLTAKAGPKILLTQPVNGVVHYHLNPKFESAVKSYVLRMIELRPHLLQAMQTVT